MNQLPTPAGVTLEDYARAADICQQHQDNPVMKALIRPLIEQALTMATPNQLAAIASRASLATTLLTAPVS